MCAEIQVEPVDLFPGTNPDAPFSAVTWQHWQSQVWSVPSVARWTSVALGSRVALSHLLAPPTALGPAPGPLRYPGTPASGAKGMCPMVPPTPFLEGEVVDSYLFF